jgi:CTP synthase
VCSLENANSKEFNEKAKYPVVDMMSKQKEVKVKGASMRLGSYPCNLLNGSKAKKAYRKNKISERHRHRYEVNNKYLDILEGHGLIISGLNNELNLVEIVELKNHPWFVGVQFHPELKSRVLKPSPLFKAFLAAAVNYYEKK